MAFSLRQVHYFVTTAALGQVSRAAEQLQVTQSAVTIAVRALEKELGYPLFARSPQGMELTEDGKRFLIEANHIEAAVTHARNMPRAQTTHEDITVAATSTLMGYFLPEHVQRLRSLHPGTHVHIVELPRREIEAGLLAGEIAVAFVNAHRVRSSALRTLALTESVRRLWVSSGHALTNRSEVSLRDIVREPLMLLTADEAAETAMRYWQDHGLKPNVQLRSASIEAIRSMVANGLGVAIASDMQYRPWSLEGKRVETVSLVDRIPPLAVGLAWRDNTELPAPAQLIVDYFRQRFHTPPQRRKSRRA